MTQLVAVSSLGDKYQYATTFSIPVLTEAWLAAAWDSREVVGHRATSKEEYHRYRLRPFQGNTVQFYGFEPEELQHMVEVLVANGGRVASGVGGNDTTHLVVDENNVDNLPEGLDVPDSCHVVRGEWFWNSIQIEAAADVGHHKRRSSVSDLQPGLDYSSGSFLDPTELKDRTLVSPENSPQRGCLSEGEVKVEGGAVFDQQEMKIIFGMMPPILKVHSDMLKKLVEAESAWSENKTVGTIILQFAEDRLKAYPPFVNFFE